MPGFLLFVFSILQMVDTRDCLIAYAWHFFGGSGQIAEYARKREAKGLIHVTNPATKPGSI